MLRAATLSGVFACVLAATVWAQQSTLPPDVSEKIGTIATSVVTSSGVPSASLAVVKDGKIAYLHAYGRARLDPPHDASPSMRYSIGSISKQFTAAAILLLVEEGKLRLDDPVSNFFPDLIRASEITVRMLLSHTSGYSDYWPEDYVMPDMLKPTTPAHIMDTWAKKPLDFDPGTKWEYSNTNYVIAGQIVEKLSGKPLVAFLTERVFRPLAMNSVLDIDTGRLTESDSTGYYRHALGPLRVAPKEGPGWLSAAAELSMTPDDLARWDLSLIHRTLLKSSSYDEMFKEVKTKDGKGTHYGLGVNVDSRDRRRHVEHSGEVSGFVSMNVVLPDSKDAIVVLTNQDASSAGPIIARAVEPLLVGRSPEEERALQILIGLQKGQIDRSLFTPACNAYFDGQALDDFSHSLKSFGEPLSVTQESTSKRGGMTFRGFRIRFADRDLILTTYEMPDGKLEQYLISPRYR